MAKGISFQNLDGADLKIGIVVARWNSAITYALRDGCLEALKQCGVLETNTIVQEIPGSVELVYGAKHLIEKHSLDAVVAIGCLIKGETMHFEYICDSVTNGIVSLNIQENLPVIYGVLTCLTEAQAVARSTGDNNHGYGWGMSAVEMALLRKK